MLVMISNCSIGAMVVALVLWESAFFLCQSGTLHEQIACEMLRFRHQVLDDEKACSGQGLQGFVAIIVHVELRGNSAESEMTGNHEGIHKIVLGQVRIRILDFGPALD